MLFLPSCFVSFFSGFFKARRWVSCLQDFFIPWLLEKGHTSPPPPEKKKKKLVTCPLFFQRNCDEHPFSRKKGDEIFSRKYIFQLLRALHVAIVFAIEKSHPKRNLLEGDSALNIPELTGKKPQSLDVLTGPGCNLWVYILQVQHLRDILLMVQKSCTSWGW